MVGNGRVRFAACMRLVFRYLLFASAAPALHSFAALPLFFLSHRPLPLYFFYPTTLHSSSLFHPLSHSLSFSKCFVWEGPRSFREMFYILQTACGRNCSTEGIFTSSAELFSSFLFLNSSLCQFFFLWFLSFSFLILYCDLFFCLQLCLPVFLSLCMSRAQR